MLSIDAIALASLMAIVSTIAAQHQHDAAASSASESTVPTPTDRDRTIPKDLPAAIREELAMLEARLRIREARVLEAERLLELERVIADETKRQSGIGSVSPREVQLIEIRLAETETQLEVRRAERAQVARMLDRLRRRIASPSPEPDVEELRAGLEGEVRAAEARFRAQETRLKAAELQVESDLARQENVLRAIKSGYVSPMSLKQTHYRTTDVRIWRDLMEAERDAARIAWERHQRRLDDFDRGDWSDGDPDRSSSDDLKARVEQLENEVQVLRDEVYYLESQRRAGSGPSAP